VAAAAEVAVSDSDVSSNITSDDESSNGGSDDDVIGTASSSSDMEVLCEDAEADVNLVSEDEADVMEQNDAVDVDEHEVVDFKANYCQSVAPVQEELEDQFSRVTWSGTRLRVHKPASDAEVRNA
jgi:hypothetical protein